MTYFRSRKKGRVHVQMPAASGLLVADLARQLIELLSDGEATSGVEVDPLEDLVAMDAPRQAPSDPALLRLFPDAYRDDPETAAEFRRFTELSLRRSKIETAEVVVATIGDLDLQTAAEETLEFELTPEQARAWMRCLTDLRLTLAARLGVTANDDEEAWLSLPEDDPREPLYRIYGWLGYQLETLLEAAR
jgi:hypothetical protein